MDYRAGNIKKGSIINVFKVSLVLFVFLCGVMVGRIVEVKDARIKTEIVNKEEIQESNLLVSYEEEIDVYFDSWKNGQVLLIVDNHGKNKLQEVSIVNMTIDGITVNSYSYLDGINPGEVRKCMVCYDAEVLDNPEVIPHCITGELYVRGSRDYVYHKIYVDIAG